MSACTANATARCRTRTNTSTNVRTVRLGSISAIASIGALPIGSRACATSGVSGSADAGMPPSTRSSAGPSWASGVGRASFARRPPASLPTVTASALCTAMKAGAAPRGRARADGNLGSENGSGADPTVAAAGAAARSFATGSGEDRSHAATKISPSTPSTTMQRMAGIYWIPTTKSLAITVQSAAPWPSAIIRSIWPATTGNMRSGRPAASASACISRASLRAIASSQLG